MRKLIPLAVAMAMLAIPGSALAALTNPQQFEVYDSTQDGLQTAIDPDIGNVETVANPGDQARVVIQTSLKKVAPNCELTVELVRDDEASNGGLSSAGHSGFIQDLGTLTTNGAGNGNAHFDVVSPDGNPDTQSYAHLDFEDRNGTCQESDGTTVGFNEYGGAPDPLLGTPFTFFE